MLTDGDGRSALAAARALASAGHVVSVLSPRVPSLASVSRAVSHRAEMPALIPDPRAGLEALERHVREWQPDVLIPTTDVAMGAVLGAYGCRVAGAVVAGPEPAAFAALSDKANLLGLAAAVGCPVPRTQLARDATELRQAAASVGLPCVLKPHRSVTRGASGLHRSGGVVLARRLDELEDLFPGDAFPVLVQEQVQGDGEGIFFLMDQGRRIAAFAHRRLREKPPWGGVSTYRESIPLPADLLGPAERLLATAKWHGVAMVEFKRSRRTGQAYLMEVNGRLWGSLQLAVDAGVNFPDLMVRLALGEPLASPAEYRVGVRSRWWWGDVDHIVARIRYPDETARAGVLPASRVAAVWQFLKWRIADRPEVWSTRDPRPFILETLNWLRGRGA